jgi:hypothetical protein
MHLLKGGQKGVFNSIGIMSMQPLNSALHGNTTALVLMPDMVQSCGLWKILWAYFRS